MSKLTKAEAKAHEQACALLEKEVLTYDERLFVLQNWHEGAKHINSVNAAFFTPVGLARDVSIYVGGGSFIDLCAGIGMLAFHAIDRWEHRIGEPYAGPRIVCLELNPDYVEVGRKVVPEATWIQADVFDLPADLGVFETAVCNPPFGRSKGLSIAGLPMELNVLAVATKLARTGVFILPQESCPFRYSGRQGYEPGESASYAKLREKVDVVLRCSSIDCSLSRDEWRGVTPNVEIAYFDLDEQELEAQWEDEEKSTEPASKPQMVLFEPEV